MRKTLLATLAALLLGATAPAFAQNYNNQALENWYRLQDQREREVERMQEQQRWMQEQQNEMNRYLNSQPPFWRR